jgi:hypothetical protein
MGKVVFDTNAYRNLISKKSFDEIDVLINEINEKEKINGISTLFSPIVAQELLAHLSDRNDSAFDRCLRANKALYLHNGSRLDCNIFSPFETMLSKQYFNLLPQHRVETYKAILQMSYQFATNPSQDNFELFKPKLEYIKFLVDSSENEFANALKNFVQKVDPLATDWQPFKNDELKRIKLLEEIRSKKTKIGMATGYAFMIYQLLISSGHKLQLTEDQGVQFATWIADTYPEPLRLFRNVFENIVNSNYPINEKSRANFVWDIQLMFGVGKHSIDNEKLYVVTADKAIIQAAVQEGANLSIFSLQDYLAYLGISI